MTDDIALYRSPTDILARLASVPIDDPEAALPFSARLARDEGWTRDYARRVVEEYLRFCALAVAGGFEATPSEDVDRAWHLHLVYTRHYWGPFATALGAPLHHNPTAGGDEEGARYRKNYAATLARYTEHFGEAPPADIWPDIEARFSALRRAPVRRGAVPIAATATAAGAAALFLASLPAQAHETLAGKRGLEWFEAWVAHLATVHTGAFALVLGVIVALFLLVRLLPRSGKSKDGSGCSTTGGASDAGSGGGSSGGSGCSGCGGGD